LILIINDFGETKENAARLAFCSTTQEGALPIRSKLFPVLALFYELFFFI